MKKILIAILVFLGAFGLASCGDGKKEEPPVETVSEYKVNFYDEAGKLLESKTLKEGSSLSYSYEPTDTKEWDYSLEGWKKDNTGSVITSLPKVSGNANYYASLTKVKKNYTLSFEMNGGSELASITKPYGTSINEPEKPKREGYRFLGWYLDNEGKKKVEFPIALKDNLTIYAKWNEEVKVLDYLKGLLNGYKLNPYSYIPDELLPASNLVNSYDPDFTKDRAINTIQTGYGEEWNMILDNLKESERFFKILSTIETISGASVVAFQNYLDNNPSDVNSFTYKEGIYNVLIKFENNIISYLISYDGNLPFFGEKHIELLISQDVKTGIRVGRVGIGDSNALKYSVTENSYTFAIKYLNSREAYFNISRTDDGKVSGHIFEYLHVASKLISSAAEFYIDDNYLSAVGNKASGIIGFTGYILELYNVKTGELLGYEVKEEKEILGKNINFDTLWFKLDDIKGINSVKALKPEKPEGLNQDLIYVNQMTNPFKTKKMSLTNPSRRYDIELRKTYLYIYDSEKEENVKVDAITPMFFVQAKALETLAEDIKDNNGIAISLGILSTDLNRLEADYEKLIPIFIQNKNNLTQEKIIEFIG